MKKENEKKKMDSFTVDSHLRKARSLDQVHKQILRCKLQSRSKTSLWILCSLDNGIEPDGTKCVQRDAAPSEFQLRSSRVLGTVDHVPPPYARMRRGNHAGVQRQRQLPGQLSDRSLRQNLVLGIILASM